MLPDASCSVLSEDMAGLGIFFWQVTMMTLAEFVLPVKTTLPVGPSIIFIVSGYSRIIPHPLLVYGIVLGVAADGLTEGSAVEVLDTEDFGRVRPTPATIAAIIARNMMTIKVFLGI